VNFERGTCGILLAMLAMSEISGFDTAFLALQAGFSGVLGLAATRLGDGLTLTVLPDEPFPAASVVKLPLLIVALQAVEAGTLRLEQRIVMQATDRAGGSGVLRVFAAGLAPTLQDLLTVMIVVSDNSATNMLFDLLGGPSAVSLAFAKLGLVRMRMYGRLMATPDRRSIAQQQGLLATTTPMEVNILLQKLVAGQLLKAELTALALDIMLEQQYTEILKRQLPETVQVRSKSGSILGVRADVGLVEYQQARYSVALFSKGCTDLRYHFDNEGVLALAQVSKLVFQVMTGEEPGL
jgi:beta-lactamase class A